MLVKQLRHFKTVVECGSITKAAGILYLSQPSLTKSIRNLEDQYGITLFERSPQGVILTEEGHDFLYYANNILSSADSLDSIFIGAKRKTPASHMRFACIQLDFIYDLVENIFRKNIDRRIHYVMEECDRISVTRKVLNSECSFGLIVGSPYDGNAMPWRSEADRLDIYEIATSGIVVCVGPASRYYDNESITFQEIMSSPNLVLDIGGQSQDQLNFEDMTTHFNTERLIFVNTISACEHFLLYTDALLYINAWAKNLFKDPRIHFLSPREAKTGHPQLLPNKLLLLKRKRYTLNKTEEHFISLLAEHFGMDRII